MRRSSEDGYAETLLSKAGLHHWHHHMVTYGEEGKDHGNYSLQKVAAIAEYAAKYELLRTVFLRCCEFGSQCSLMDSVLVRLNAADGFPASLKDQSWSGSTGANDCISTSRLDPISHAALTSGFADAKANGLRISKSLDFSGPLQLELVEFAEVVLCHSSFPV
ncbi:hypothetical protein FOZ62_007144 [Perkinsus olseni]|uniref:Uncharacterized protein n=1 Tax=Perkinsus olseni TaxID=32597 RepID=A0A7J6SRF1_PEROL|nr:hypothetical protein FOZ62_007144 [Perkinsus olseni]